MPKYERFEDLPVWQEAAKLYNCALDFLEKPNLPVSSGFRGQLDRAALSVSNNIAEGFWRITTAELISFLGIARGSAAEVCSMIAVVAKRPKLGQFAGDFARIQQTAESCGRQLSAWMGAIEESPVQGKRHLSGREREKRETEQNARNFRTQFLRNLKPNHPLYNTPEAKAARGEKMED
jgi:four helix bundle protein